VKKGLKIIFSLTVILLIIVLVLFLKNNYFTDEVNLDISKEQWKEDIIFLQESLKKKHPGVFDKITEETYNKYFTNLINDVNDISSEQIQFRLMEIFAFIGDSHSGLRGYFTKENKVIPINLYSIQDGYYIINTDEKYKKYLGNKVVSINKVPINEIIEKIKTLIPHENDSVLKSFLTSYLKDVNILKYID